MSATHAYVGRGKCGHVYLLVVDDGTKSNGASLAKVIRRGGTIDRVTIEAARASSAEWCTCTRAARKAEGR